MTPIIIFIIGILIGALIAMAYFNRELDKLDAECRETFAKAETLIRKQQNTIKQQAQEIAYYKLGGNAKNTAAERVVGSDEVDPGENSTEQTS